MSIVRRLPELLVPAALILLTAWLGLEVSTYLQAYFLDTLVKVAIVVALYVFIGNSGVLSFGTISFVALGAWTAGVLTVPEDQKRFTMPGLAHFLVTANVGNVASLALAAAVGAVAALAVGLPLMRLSGLAAGIATFAVLEITNNVLTYEQKIGPGLNAFSSVPQTTGIWQAAVGGVICVAVAYLYQRTRFGRMLRATREDPAAARAAGISIYRQRLLAFTLSGALAGFAGAIYVQLQPLQVPLRLGQVLPLDLEDRAPLLAFADEYVARLAPQARAGADRTGANAPQLGELLAHGRRIGFAPAPLQVGNYAFEGVMADGRTAAFAGGRKSDRLVAASVQNFVLERGIQCLPRDRDIHAAMACQGLEHLEGLPVARVPAAHRAGVQRQLGVGHDPGLVEEFVDSQAVAGRARTERIVEREQPRFQIRGRVTAHRARIPTRKLGLLAVVQIQQQGTPVSDPQRRLERFGQP